MNFETLLKVLRSKDPKLLEEYKDYFENKNFKFLDGSVPKVGQRVWFGSYPRSGNSFLRKYLEMVTGVTTGADTMNLLTIDFQM
jgi:hypothetical protein